MNPADTDPSGIAPATEDTASLAPASRPPDTKTRLSPSHVMSQRALRLNKALIRRAKEDTKLDDALAVQAHMLDSLFRELLLHDAAGDGFNEAFGLALALRTQKQFRQAYETIESLKLQKDRERWT